MAIVRRGSGRGKPSGGHPGSLWGKLGARFWFVPALITAGAVALFWLTQAIDQLTQTYLGTIPIFFSGGATAARSVLAAIAGGIISVTGTVFSITIVTLQLASSSYTPRVLRSFTSDRGVQIVLGTFVGTFLYSLLVLRIVREAQAEGASFNPVISVTVALVLALLCVALLIYFIAHVVNLIQSSTIVESVHEDTLEAIAWLEDLEDAPLEDPDSAWDRPELAELLAADPLVVRAGQSGYVQYLDVGKIVERVMRGAKGGAQTTVVEVPFGSGTFVAAGLPLVKVWPARALPQGVEDEVLDAAVIGKERFLAQDFAFGLRQLSDIALKGLSPGVNDPTTAMQAMDRMEAIFVALGEKRMPAQSEQRKVGGAKAYVKVGYYDFDAVVSVAFDQVRRAAFTIGETTVLERLLEILERAIQANGVPERQRSLWARAFTVARLAPEQVSDPEDAANLVRRAVGVGASLLGTDLRAQVAFELKEVADLADGLRGGGRIREAVDAALGELS